MAEVKYTCEGDIFCGVNKPKDKNNLVELEKKHMAVIKAPDGVKKDEVFEVSVRIGGIDGVEHPNEPGHFIEWVELYCGDTFLGRCGFNGGTSYPSAVFKVKLSHAHGPLKVWSKCNLHGLWESVTDLKMYGS